MWNMNLEGVQIVLDTATITSKYAGYRHNWKKDLYNVLTATTTLV